MLKIGIAEEERRGSFLMVHWDGHGAVRVLKHAPDALLMERATGQGSLKEMVLAGKDDEASSIICGVVTKLHKATAIPTLPLIPLQEWFKKKRKEAFATFLLQIN